MSRKDIVFKYFREQEDEINERVSQGIEKNRKGYMSLTVTDECGNPVSNAKVQVILQKHEFMHGANIFMLDELETEEKNQIYREKFKEAFNLATIPFYWSDLEPEQGKPRFDKNSPKVYRRPAIDLCLEYCEANRIMPKAHCLNYFAWTPKWCPDDIEETKILVEKRFRELAEKYATRIIDWEVINETLTGYYQKNHKIFYEPNIIEWSFELARKYFPNNRLIINEGPYESFTNFKHDRHPYYMQIERALLKGATIDSIGVQFHMFSNPKNEAEGIEQLGNPKKILEALDRYAHLGLPIQITETTFPAFSWGSEDEDIQAELLRRYYSLWFSHEAVEGIVYWNLVDGYAAWAPQGDMTCGENIFYGGLLRFDMTEKPAFQVVKELFQKEWHTEETFVTNEQGCGQFKGFYGTYKLVIEANGTKSEHFVEFKKEGDAEIKI